MRTFINASGFLPIVAVLAACGATSRSQEPTIPPSTLTPSPFFDSEVGLATQAPPQASTAKLPTPTVRSPSGPTRTPRSGVLSFNPLDGILFPGDIPGPYTFSRPLLAGNPNSDVLIARGQEEGSQFIAATGRIDGARAEFTTHLDDPPGFFIFRVHLIIFRSHAGPSFLLAERGGICRPEDDPNFILMNADLGIGDASALCTDGMQYWLRVAYRNVYFDIMALGITSPSDIELLSLIASAQLAKLDSLPAVDSIPTQSPPIPTTTWTSTPPGTVEVFPTPAHGPSWITEADNGKAFFYYPTIRFGLDLDPTYYLKRDLDYSECNVIGLGEISNWSLNGPDSLPVGFEASGSGECTIRIRAFLVHIVVVDYP